MTTRALSYSSSAAPAAADLHARALAFALLLALLLALLAARATHAASAYTAPFRSFAAAQYPVALALADLNGDGWPDVVTANGGNWNVRGAGNTVSVLLGRGDGSFLEHMDFETDSIPVAVAVADVNGDGIADLVTANGGSYPAYRSSVSVLRGDGDGWFEAHVDYAMPRRVTALAVADLNADGAPDLVVALTGVYGAYGSAVRICLNDGLGNFGSHTDVTVGAGPGALLIADFDGDGRLDLATANAGDNTVSVLRGDGHGGFGGRVDYTLHEPAQQLSLGDVTGDGVPDLLATCSGETFVMPGHGDGTFGAAGLYANASAGSPVAAGDLDGDGHLDLAGCAWTRMGLPFAVGDAIHVTRGLGAGAFGAYTSFAAGPLPSAIALADLDGDGRLDAVTANEGGTVTVHMGNGDGTLGPANVPVSSSCAGQLVLADLNGDGRLDAVGMNTPSVLGQGAVVEAALGDGAGHFTASWYGQFSWPVAVAAADFDGDGHADLAIANGAGYGGADDGEIRVVRGDGHGGFASLATIPVVANVLVVGDLNHDGALDLLAATGGVTVALGHGDGTFAAPVTYATGSVVTGLALADMNGDGQLDVVATHSPGNVAVLFGNGDGTLRAAVDYAAGAGACSPVVIDVNRDGKPDVVTANSNAGTVSVLHGGGAGTLGTRLDIEAGDSPTAIAAAYLDRDAVIDLVVADLGANGVTVLYGAGDIFVGRTDYGTGCGPNAVAVAPVCGSLESDIVVGNLYSGTITVLRPAARAETQLTAWGSLGTGPGQFLSIHGIATTAAGNVVAIDADLRRVEMFTPDGMFLRQWDVLDSAGLTYPVALAARGTGEVDVLVRAANGAQWIKRYADDGTLLGQLDACAGGDDVQCYPIGLACDDSGHVWVSDDAVGVKELAIDGTVLRRWPNDGSTPLVCPWPIALGPDHSVYVGDACLGAIQRFDREGHYLGTSCPFQTSMTSFAVAPDGHLLVVDDDSGGLDELTADGRFVTSWSTWGSDVPFSVGAVAVTVDAAGVVYLAAPQRIMKLGPIALASVPRSDGPLRVALAAPAPNPSAGPVRLRFTTARRGPVALELFDLAGRRIEQWQWSALEPGPHEVTWSGASAARAPGVFFCRLRAGGETHTRSVIRLR